MRRIAFICLAFGMAAGLLPARAAAPRGQDSLAGKAAQSDSATAWDEHDAEADFVDVRFRTTVAPLPAATAAVNALRRSVPTLRVDWNHQFGTIKQIVSDDGMLTAAGMNPKTTDKIKAERVARTFLSQYRGMFGLDTSALANLKTTRLALMPKGGPYALVLRTMYGGIETFNGGTIGFTIARDGSIVSAWADTSRPGIPATTPKISASDAIETVARHEKVDGFQAKINGVVAGRKDQLTIFRDGGLVSGHNARLVIMPSAKGPRLAWRVFFAKEHEELLLAAVDALTGEFLFRYNQVRHNEGTVYQNYPGAPRGGQAEVVSFEGDKEASPLTWLGLPINATQKIDLHTTIGNNVFAWTDWLFPKFGPAGQSLRGIQGNAFPDSMPFSADNKFNYNHTQAWSNDCAPTSTPAKVDAPAPVGPQTPPARRTVENPSYARDREAAVTNIFFLINRIHDLSFKYGFTEGNGNFQWQNFTPDGKGKDPVRYNAQSAILGNALNNANMFTPVDGGEPVDFISQTAANPAGTRVLDYAPPRGNMYMWRFSPVKPTLTPQGQPVRYCVDGDFDASVAWHEYTHGISNRLVGGPDDAAALGAPQSGAMGESWSDWVAMSFLNLLGLESGSVTGIYDTSNTKTGIRNFDMGNSPLVYGDFGYGPTGPQVHADGEIWSATLWQMRKAMQAKLGKVKGAEAATHLVFDGLAIGPRLPTYLHMRDAIIAADKARFRGANNALIWSVFASRGMGVSAKADDAKDTTPTPGFDVPGANNGIIRGTIYDADGGALPGVKVVVGGFAEGQPNATVRTARNGTFALKLQPGAYKLTLAAPGYGVQPAGVLRVVQGTNPAVQYLMSKNLASLGFGGVVTSGLGDGDEGLALLDDRDTTARSFEVGKPVVIKLAGTAAATLKSVTIAHRPQTGNPATLASKWLVETSINGTTWKALSSGGTGGATTAFRPKITDYTRKGINANGVKARFVRITAKETLSEGLVTSMSDIQVLGSAPGVKIFKRSFTDYDEEGNVQVANTQQANTVTFTAWQNSCTKPTAPLQGFDSYIVELRPEDGDGFHFLTVTNKGGTATDLDVFLYGADCKTSKGRIATAAASEAGLLPSGTRWVQIHLYAGTTEGFSVNSKSTLEPVPVPNLAFRRK